MYTVETFAEIRAKAQDFEEWTAETASQVAYAQGIQDILGLLEAGGYPVKDMSALAAGNSQLAEVLE